MDNNSSELRYQVFDLDEVVDEKNNQYIALRKLQWFKEGQEPDESKAKIEIRRWSLKDEKETAGKGCTFLTDEGPHELVRVMIEKGFGHTTEIVHALATRDNLKEELNDMISVASSSEKGENSSYAAARAIMEAMF